MSATTSSTSTFIATAHCPQCNVERRVSEQFAFGGMDRLRMTLATCGHPVLRP
jgi:hypothetical protein